MLFHIFVGINENTSNLIISKNIFLLQHLSSGFNKISNYCTYADISFNLPMNILQYIMKGQHFLEADLKYHAALSQKVLLIESSNDSLVPLDESLDLFRVI